MVKIGSATTGSLGGETVTLLGQATGAVNSQPARSFGLSANFVGGDLDELGDRNEIGVWRGRGGVFEILAPAFDDTGGGNLSTLVASEDGTALNEIYLEPDATKGRLLAMAANVNNGPETTVASHRAVARLIERLSALAITVELLV